MILLLLLLWILLNGKVTAEVIATGAAVSAALTCFAYRMFHIPPREELRILRGLPGAVLFVLYLIGQVAIANLQVMRLLLSGPAGRDRGRPRLVWFRSPCRSPGGKLALTSAITQTPGTVTVGVKGDMICVYALNGDFSQGLDQSGFTRRLCRLEEKNHG